MGSLAPPASVSSSASFFLPSLTPAMDNWFISSTSDHLLTEALTRELRSASASSSSSSGPSLEVSQPCAQNNKYSDGGLLHLQAQSNISQVGSPLSSDSVCKEQLESPFNHTNGGSVFGMSTKATVNCDPIVESSYHHQVAPQRSGYNKAPQAPSGALSSQAAAGSGVTKVSKRRSRSNKKVPMAVLCADTSNFRAMVQQLTGIPAPPQAVLPHVWGTSGVPLLKPQPTRLSPLDMTTLDTSSSFLAPGNHALPAVLVPSFEGKGKFFLGASHYPDMRSYDALLSSSSSSISFGTSPVELLANANSDGNWARGDSKHPTVAATMAKEGERCAAAGPLTSTSSLENFLMDYEDLRFMADF